MAGWFLALPDALHEKSLCEAVHRVKFATFLTTWEGLQLENRWSRICTASLLLIVVLLSIKILRKETIIVLQPGTLTTEAWVASKGSSQSYKEAWGLFLAQLVGNVTPNSLEFIKERLQPLLAPKVYQEVMDEVNIQAQQIKKDRLSLRFEPKSVEYEVATGKVFVCGTSFENGAGGRSELRSDRTYEFVITINNYGPLITSISTYSGPPRTVELLQEQTSNAMR